MRNDIIKANNRISQLEDQVLKQDIRISDLIKENNKLAGRPNHHHSHNKFREIHAPHRCIFCDSAADYLNPFSQQVCFKHRVRVQ